jgi:hypothetical protein
MIDFTNGALFKLNPAPGEEIAPSVEPERAVSFGTISSGAPCSMMRPVAPAWTV